MKAKQTKYVGISKGKEYPIFKRKEDNEKIGLTECKECITTMFWATFEVIKERG